MIHTLKYCISMNVTLESEPENIADYISLNKITEGGTKIQISLRWSIHIINSFDKTKLSCDTPTYAAPQFL